MAQVLVQTELETPSVERVSSPNYHDIRERFHDLFAYESVGRWLRKKQPRTMGEYLPLFEKFLRWSEPRINVASPTEFLAWAKARDGTEVQDLLDEYVEGSSTSKSQIITALLRSFLARNGYRDLPKIDWACTMNPDREGYKRPEIQNFLGYLRSPFQKLYVLAAVDSGLRANDLLNLTYGQIREDFEAGQKYVYIRFPKDAYQRRKAPGRTFLGPNSLDLLRVLVKEGKVKTESKAKIFPFVYSTITGSLKWAAKEARLRQGIQPSHGLRKFFESCLDRVGMDHHKKNLMTGHSNGVIGTYTSKDVDELRGLYEAAYRYLDLSEQAAADTRVGELERTIQDQAKKIVGFEEQLGKQKDIEERLKRMEKAADKDLEAVKSFVKEWLPRLESGEYKLVRTNNKREN